MVLTADATPASAAPPEARRRRPRRRTVVLLLVAVLVVAGAAVAATAVAFRYLHAAPLSTSGGGWTGTDRLHTRRAEAGSTSALIVSPRPGHRQTFELTLENFSPVTQTVLGLTDGRTLADPRQRAEPVHLLVSSRHTYYGDPRAQYTSEPVSIPPGGQYRLRFVHETGGEWAACQAEFWDGLSLQVRVGWFTRTETLDFGGLVMEIQKPGRGC